MDEREDKPRTTEPVDPALTSLGTAPREPLRPRAGDIIHTAPEFAVAEADVRSAEQREFVRGTSLWRDAWRRLLKNKLAVIGLVIVALLTLASLVGPPLIKATTGFTYDYIPREVELLKSFPPFTGVNGRFSWAHPMGTDNSGRDLLARVLLGGRISLMVGIISTLVSLIIGIAFGATAGYAGGKVDEVMMRIV